MTARRKYAGSKGDALLHEARRISKTALRQGIKKSRIHCWKDLIGKLEKDPWGLAFKTVDAIQAMADITTKARRGTGKRKGFCALISIDIRNAFNTTR